MTGMVLSVEDTKINNIIIGGVKYYKEKKTGCYERKRRGFLFYIKVSVIEI